MKLANWVTTCCKSGVTYTNGSALHVTCKKCKKELLTKVK